MRLSAEIERLEEQLQPGTRIAVSRFGLWLSWLPPPDISQATDAAVGPKTPRVGGASWSEGLVKF